jgi:DNA invertase Pin-like site-specific DNA recombinase
MAIAYSYIRFSSKPQELGDSLKRQLENSQEYCNKHQLTLSDKRFEDLGISAHKKVKRPGLEELKIAVEEKRIRSGDYILLDDFSRLSRKGFDSIHQDLRMILLEGVVVVSIKDDLALTQDSLNNPKDIIRIAVYAESAFEESNRKSMYQQSVWDRKGQEALSHKTPKTSICPAWLIPIREGNKVIGFDPIPAKVRIIERIFEMSASGFGRRRICEILTNDKTPHIYSDSKRASGKWHPSYIAKLFNSPAVIGTFIPSVVADGKRKLDYDHAVTEYFPKVISHSLYQKVQLRKQRLAQKGGGRRGQVLANLLQGVAKCEGCGGSMGLIVKNKAKNERYLKCRESSEGRCDHKSSYRYTLVEAGIIHLLLNYPVIKAVEQPKGIDHKARIQNEIDLITDKIKAKADTDFVAEVKTSIIKLDTERKLLTESLEEFKRQETSPTAQEAASIWQEFRKANFGTNEESRTRVNSTFKNLGVKLFFNEKKLALTRTTPGTEGKIIPNMTSIYFEYASGTLKCIMYDIKTVKTERIVSAEDLREFGDIDDYSGYETLEVREDGSCKFIYLEDDEVEVALFQVQLKCGEISYFG